MCEIQIQTATAQDDPHFPLPLLLVDTNTAPLPQKRRVIICGREALIDSADEPMRLALLVLGKVVCDEQGRVTRSTVDHDFVMAFTEAVRFNLAQGRPLRTYGMSQLRDIKTYVAASLDAQREKPVLRGVGGCKPKSPLGIKPSHAWA